MLKHYITIALRQFKKNKLYTTINVLCLSIGISFSMFIGIYILNQQAINTGLNKVENQVILKSKWKEKDQGLDITTITALAKAIKEEYPRLVANYYRYNPVTNVVSAGDKFFKEDIAIGDTTFVSMYGFPLAYGDKDHAFHNNSSAVITESLALKLFETKNAIGKTLSVQTTVAGIKQDFTVSAILKDLPYNSITKVINSNYTVFIPMTGNRYFAGGDFSLDWNNAGVISFLQLQPGVSRADLKLPLASLLKKYSSEFIQKNLVVDPTAIKDYHLKDNNGALIKMMTALSLIAAFILIMVIINFININIGSSASRLKEIGLRKTFGSERKQVIQQFVLEALAITFIASIISLITYQLLIPVFSQVLNMSFPSFWQFSSVTIIILIVFVILIGLLAGSYPAIVLSRTNLVHAVKGKIDGTKGGLILKRVLLTTQFSLAIFVFICGLNISRQVSYIFNKDLGYNKDQLLVVAAFPKQWDSAGVFRMETIKQNLLQVPSVKNVSLTFEVPERVPVGGMLLFPDKSTGTENGLNIPLVVADEDYANTFGIQVKSGSFFNENRYGIVLNETAVKQLGFDPDNIVGRKIRTPARENGILVAGVVKDYNVSSMEKKIGPVGFIHVKNQNLYRFLAIKLNTGNMLATMEALKNKWRSLVPDAPFDYSFMDEKFASLYQSELQLQKASGIATVLNLIIVLLGIIGVVSFMLQKRTKEMAVRKVLGANAFNIIILFLKEYTWLILIANIIAWPAAYLITEKLLDNFAYRVGQNVGPYVLALAIVGFISFALVSLQCFRTAVANPVKSLKAE